MYAITFSSFEEVCTAFFQKEPMKVGESVCGVQNKIGKEDKMANKVENLNQAIVNKVDSILNNAKHSSTV